MIVYWDYDGVFGDTMTPAIAEMKELGLYDTEEGRTKYFRELDWSKFLVKAGFMENAIEAINMLTDKGYKQAFLTHVNSFPEHIDKIYHIKNTREIKNAEDIDVIAVPRKYDKSFTVNAKGNILVDDRLENIEAWEAAGGIGIWFSDKENAPYRTTNDLLKTVNIITVVRKALVTKEEVSRKNMIDKVSELIKSYKNRIHALLIYDKLVNEGDIIDKSYDISETTKLKKGIGDYYDLVNGEVLYAPTIIYEDVQNFFSLIMQIDEKIKSEEYKDIKNEVNRFYSNDSTINEQKNYEDLFGISDVMENQPVYKHISNSVKWKNYYKTQDLRDRVRVGL